MRLNENTYPAYSTLEKGDLAHIKIDKLFETIITDEKFLSVFIVELYSVFLKANKRKYYLTMPFKEAINTAFPKIIDKEKHLPDVKTESCIIFTENGFTICTTNYNVKDVKCQCYGFTRDALTTYGYINNDDAYSGLACSVKDGMPYHDSVHLGNYLNGIMVALYFINNCEIQQKIIAPNEKYRANGERHYNESKSDFIVLDCGWFTELIRDAPFHVRGHLRWQVHGEKNTKRKLKWIDEYEKTGYHRQAKKIENDNIAISNKTNVAV